MKNGKSMIILLVALAVLTVITLVALLFFFPKEPAKTAAVPAPVTAPGTPGAIPGTPLPDEFDPVEWTRNPQATAGQVPAAKPASPDDQGFTVTLPAEPVPGASGTQALPPSPGATFPGEAPAVPAVKPAAVASTPVEPAPAAKAPAAKPAAKPAPAPKAPAAKPAVKAATPTATGYWIQVASFKDRYQAENTAKALEAQGLKGTLTTASVNGQTVVRVRVGPYANEAEAAKFLAWLKPVKEFEASYITKVGPKAP